MPGEDIVGAVLLLACDASRQINGEVITITGGYRVWAAPAL